jgi:nucleoside-diphosphate-sugar epimerase
MSTHLVTGATGFVGRALVERLLREGHSVRVLARDDADRARWAGVHGRAVEPFVASLGDPNSIAQAAEGADVVFHCASESSPRAPSSALAWVNIAGSENVRNAARHAGVRRLIHLSCADVTLANRDRLSWRETQQLGQAPLDAVSRTKLLAEELALQESDRRLEICALRPAWIWGPGDTTTLPALCREAARGRVRLCGGGDNLLATVYIDNVVHALLLAARAPSVCGLAYHVLDDEALTAREFLGQLCKAAGLPAPRGGLYALEYCSAWLRERVGLPGLVRRDVVRRGRGSLYDGGAAVRDLGYEARVSIEAGMQALASWVERSGGAAELAKIARNPTNTHEVERMMRLAESHG